MGGNRGGNRRCQKSVSSDWDGSAPLWHAGSTAPADTSILGYNRSRVKSEALAKQVRNLTVCGSAAEVLAACDLVFAWMNQVDASAVLEENRTLIARRGNLLAACIPGVPLGKYSDRWAVTFPNVNMPAGRGITLVQYSPELGETDRASLRDVLAAVGTVHELPAEEFTYYSALCSAGPALYATMLEIVADTLAERRGYDREFCRRLVHEGVLGTVFLQDQDGLDAAGFVERVAHPGGPSEAGVHYLRRDFAAYVAGMFQAMRKW